MLNKNQIKRLLEQCKKQQPQQTAMNPNPRKWNRIRGWIEALTFVLNEDKTTINNLPINNKEKVNATNDTGPNMD